ncbi:Hypothetical protein POVR1_LOCUS402 [uncultured virus]|nr:Hypothetical protein POVR1_LOCUS402 [uncultured virus]
MQTILDNHEIFFALIQHADIQALIRLYYFVPTKFEDPFILGAIAEANEIPYQIIVADKDRRKTITLIQSFEQLVTSMNLRTEEGLSSTCLSDQRLMEIAIYEQDPKLFQMLATSRSYRIRSVLSRKIGETGNIKLIEAAWTFIRTYKTSYSDFLGGLAKRHFNDLFYRYFELEALDKIYGVIYEGVVLGDNLEILVFLDKKIPIPVGKYLIWVGKGNSQRILDYLMSEMDFTEDMYLELMKGYLKGGHAEKAKRIYPMMERLGKELELEYAIESGSVETLIYAEELQKQIFGHGFRFLHVREMSFHGIWNESVRYYLDHRPHWRKAFMLNGLIPIGKLEDLIEYTYRYDSKLIYVQEYLRYLTSRYSNKCYLNWLIREIGSDAAGNLLASIEPIDVDKLLEKMNAFRGKTILSSEEASDLDDILRQLGSPSKPLTPAEWADYNNFSSEIELVSVAD